MASDEIDQGFLASHIGFQVNMARRAIFAAVAGGRPKLPRQPSGFLSTLVLIGMNPGISQKRIADELFLDPAVLVTIIDKLEAAGLVERRKAAADRRRSELHLTELGREELAVAEATSAEREEQIAAALSPEERQELLRLLTKLRLSLPRR